MTVIITYTDGRTESRSVHGVHLLEWDKVPELSLRVNGKWTVTAPASAILKVEVVVSDGQ